MKAETFSATDLDEYSPAKQSLKNAVASQLEVKARRILSTHGVLADPRCNVRLDLPSGPTLLIRDVPVDAGLVGGGGGSRTIMAADVRHSDATAVGRQLNLSLEGEDGAEEHHHHDDANAAACYGGESTVEDRRAAAGIYNSSGFQDATMAAGAPAVVELVGGTDVTMTSFGQPRERGKMQLSQQQVQQLVQVRRNAERDFLEYVSRQEEEYRRACDSDQTALEARDAEETYRQEYIARLDARSVQEEERLTMENRRLVAEEERRLRDEEERKRRSDADRLKELWASDGAFFRLLSFAAASLAAATFAFRKGFSLAPGAILDAAWGFVVAECAAGQGRVADQGTADASFAVSQAEGASCSALAEHEGGVCGAGGTGGGWWGEVTATGSSNGVGERSESALWWVCSTAGASAWAIIRGGYSSTGWLLGQTLDLVVPASVQCEIGAVLSLACWLLTLMLAMKLTGWLLGRGAGGHGTVDAAVHWMLLAAWVWARFHDLVQHASLELLPLVAPTPVLVLAYGAALGYVERHRKPDGCWWVRGWDVRWVWSRALPFVASGALACVLGVQAS